jgi:hypothetical protein
MNLVGIECENPVVRSNCIRFPSDFLENNALIQPGFLMISVKRKDPVETGK